MIANALQLVAHLRAANINGLERFDVCGDVVTLLLTGASTHGQYFVCEILSPYREGVAMPMHVHPDIDQAYMVLEGAMNFDLSGERGCLEKNQTLLIPRGTPHRVWTRGPGTCRGLMISTPADLEILYRQIGLPIQSSLPDMDLTVDDMEFLADRIFTQFHEQTAPA
jgi:mannose-6-phosphate isomerase-like protein (cupin superfamily)